MMLQELAAGVGRMGWAVRRGEQTLRRIRDLRGSGADQEPAIARSLPATEPQGEEERPEIVVCVSGCLAHLYVRGEPRRLTLEAVRERCPGLVPALLAHPGVGFAVAEIASGEVLASARTGYGTSTRARWPSATRWQATATWGAGRRSWLAWRGPRRAETSC